MDKKLYLFLLNLRNIGPVTTIKLREKIRKHEDTKLEDVSGLEKILYDTEIFTSVLENVESKKYLKEKNIHGINLLADDKESDEKLLAIKEEIKNAVKKAQQRAIEILADCKENDIKVLCVDDNLYPPQLLKIDDAPPVIYYKGNIAILKKSINIAVVGTRSPTSYATKIGIHLGEYLAKKKIVVVSGLAIGCDTNGHNGCLNGGGKTVGIMAEGLDHIHPVSNKELASKIIESGGCLISEYPPKTRANKQNFVRRDRIESGISHGVIVVETDIKSGTMHTVGFTKKQKRLLGVMDFPEVHKLKGAAVGNAEILKESYAKALWSENSIKDFIKECKKPPLLSVEMTPPLFL